MSPWRWFIVVVLTLLIVGLLGWVRGPAHHHGDDVGSKGAVPASAHVRAGGSHA